MIVECLRHDRLPAVWKETRVTSLYECQNRSVVDMNVIRLMTVDA